MNPQVRFVVFVESDVAQAFPFMQLASYDLSDVKLSAAYCSRSECAGSTWIARMAGFQQASRATAIMRTSAMA
jgi:hypothetical protein